MSVDLGVNTKPQMVLAFVAGGFLMLFGLLFGALSSIVTGLFFVVFFGWMAKKSRATLHDDCVEIRRFMGNADVKLANLAHVETRKKALILHTRDGKKVAAGPFHDVNMAHDRVQRAHEAYLRTLAGTA